MDTNNFSDAHTGARPAVRRDEIQVWRIPLEISSQYLSSLVQLLTPAEREQSTRFHFARDARRFVVRRAVRRLLLAKILGIQPDLLGLLAGANGKPTVKASTGTSSLKFNCSHSGDWALIAISYGIELGVDLEEHRELPEAEQLAKNYFSVREIREFAALPAELKRMAFFNCWTRKEAFLKAIGLGLSFPLDHFSVSLAPDQPAALLAVDSDPDAVAKWSMISLDAGKDFSAALVHEAVSAVNITQLDWQFAPPV